MIEKDYRGCSEKIDVKNKYLINYLSTFRNKNLLPLHRRVVSAMSTSGMQENVRNECFSLLTLVMSDYAHLD